MKLSYILSYIFSLYFFILVLRVFLTWIPTINWRAPFFNFLAKISDIYLEPFKKIIPPLGGLDFSPIIAILLLQFCQRAICTALFRMGL